MHEAQLNDLEWVRKYLRELCEYAKEIKSIKRELVEQFLGAA